jgi:hypothetical protein
MSRIVIVIPYPRPTVLIPLSHPFFCPRPIRPCHSCQQTALHCPAKYRARGYECLALALIPKAVRAAVFPYWVAYFLMKNKHHKLLSHPPASN